MEGERQNREPQLKMNLATRVAGAPLNRSHHKGKQGRLKNQQWRKLSGKHRGLKPKKKKKKKHGAARHNPMTK